MTNEGGEKRRKRVNREQKEDYRMEGKKRERKMAGQGRKGSSGNGRWNRRKRTLGGKGKERGKNENSGDTELKIYSNNKGSNK